MWQHLAVLTLVPLVATTVIAVEGVLARSAEVADVRAARDHLVAAEQLDAVRRAVDNETLPTLALAVMRGSEGTQPGALTPQGQLQLALVGSRPVTEARTATDETVDSVNQPEALAVLRVARLALQRARSSADTGGAHVASLSAQYTRLADSLLTAEHQATAGAAALASTRSRTAAAVSDVERVIDLSAQASRQLPLAFTTVTAVQQERSASLKQLQAALGGYVLLSWGSTDLSTPQLRQQALAAITDARTRDLTATVSAAAAGPPVPGSADRLLRLRGANHERDSALDAVLHVALAESAAAAEADSAGVQRALAATVATAALLLMVSALVTAVVAQRLTLSLRDLRTAARRALDGEAVTAAARGPQEVRTASEALELAAAATQRVREQAEAVAEGDLLRALELPPVPGRLGAALHSSIEAVVHAVEARDALRAELLHRATHDGLTGLANRSTATAALTSALEACARRTGVTDPEGVAVLFVDLDGFKTVNDRHGHAAGDAVLVAVAGRLRAAIRSSDLAARLGGDEFVVVLGDVDQRGALEVATRIVADLQVPVAREGGGPELSVGASVGLAHRDASAAGATSAEELLADADDAVYRAKRLGRGRVVVHDEQVCREQAERVSLARQLRTALQEGALDLVWEPVVALDPAAPTRWRAVPRWQPDAGGVLVGEGLATAAAAAGMSEELGRWVLSAATGEAARWTRSDVVVGLTDRCTTDPGLADRVVDALVDSGLPATALTLLLAESALSGHPDAARSLAVLRAAGVRIAVEGSGTTPLRDLPLLPVDEVWLDASPEGPQDAVEAATAELLLSATTSLRADLVVSGVATAEHLRVAQERGAAAVCGELAAQRCGQEAPVSTRGGL